MNSAVRKSASEIKIFPLLAGIASAFMWQKATFIGAYLRASHLTSHKLNSQIHHDACREDELTSLKVISAQRYYHCVEALRAFFRGAGPQSGMVPEVFTAIRQKCFLLAFIW
jgi:hypothetical protein